MANVQGKYEESVYASEMLVSTRPAIRVLRSEAAAAVSEWNPPAWAVRRAFQGRHCLRDAQGYCGGQRREGSCRYMCCLLSEAGYIQVSGRSGINADAKHSC